jgi:hypothetical protein
MRRPREIELRDIVDAIEQPLAGQSDWSVEIVKHPNEATTRKPVSCSSRADGFEPTFAWLGRCRPGGEMETGLR